MPRRFIRPLLLLPSSEIFQSLDRSRLCDTSEISLVSIRPIVIPLSIEQMRHENIDFRFNWWMSFGRLGG